MPKVSAILPWIKRRLRNLERHPIDLFYGVDTSRAISPNRIKSAENQKAATNLGYVGSHPSVVRQSLELLPDLTDAAFLDLGCGKGRVCVIATEYGFGRIIGIEFGVKLAKVAARNARVMQKRFPARTKIEIQTRDATRFEPPSGAGMMVVFLYNPFGEALIGTLRSHLETIVAESGRKIFIVYYNPVQFAVLDESPVFERFSAVRYNLPADERGAALFGDGYESVIIYQSRGPDMAEPHPGASRKATVTIPNFGAVVEA